MPLAETVILEIGSAIAKSVLQLWIKDIPVISDVSANAMDLLKSHISDRIAQQKAKRQFEAIGEMVGENLLPLFETENSDLDEGGRTSVAIAVAETFRKSHISADLIVKGNLESARLARYFLDIRFSANNCFSSTEEALYERIIKESCEYIVNIASQLPNFTESAFAEILKRDEQILTIVKGVSQDIRKMRELFNPDGNTKQFELEYRRAIASNLGELQLFGTNLSVTNRRHRLSIAYITLSVAQRKVDLPTTGDNDPKADKTDVKEQESIVTVDRALIGKRHIVIRGPAGSGKTSLLQWIAVQAAQGGFQGQLSDWNKAIPFYIRLRQFAKLDLPHPEIFPSLVAKAVSETKPKGWVTSTRTSGRSLFLIDGLDEVPEAQYEEVCAWLKDLIRTYDKARFIITSRPHTPTDWLSSKEFNFIDAELQPMSLLDIYTFIDHWHNAVKEDLQEEIEIAELLTLAENLKRTVENNHSIRSLATSPLLCAMLCALNRERHTQLPKDRIELYEECCNLLIEKRDQARRIGLDDDYPFLGSRQKYRFLEDLAYWLITNGWSEVDKQQAENYLAQKLADMPNLPHNASGASILRLFIERTGIICEPAVDQISFTHRTFQEFLAARAAIGKQDIDTLVQHAHTDQWREMIILSSGLAKRENTNLIRRIIERGDAEKEHQYYLHLLAVSCLETSMELDPDVKNAVEKRLTRLVPPKNMTEASALAAAGELAIPYLDKDRQHPESTHVICVRTLALIGGNLALEALEKYASGASFTLKEELLRSWDFFDKEIYARRVLSKALYGYCTIQARNVSSLENFQHFTNLGGLHLSGYNSGYRYLSNLQPLAGLTQLISLRLVGCWNLEDLSPLSNLTQLTFLDLAGCWRIKDLEPLTNLTQLTSLDLSSCEASDLNPLANLTNLTSLDLSSCRQIEDLSPLANLTQLTSLSLSECQKLSDLSPLANLIQLTKLDLSSCKQIANLKPLTKLTCLVSLNLSSCAVNDLSPLANLIHLTSLDLSSCQWSGDLSSLVSANKLEIIVSKESINRVCAPQNLKIHVVDFQE